MTIDALIDAAEGGILPPEVTSAGINALVSGIGAAKTVDAQEVAHAVFMAMLRAALDQ